MLESMCQIGIQDDMIWYVLSIVGEILMLVFAHSSRIHSEDFDRVCYQRRTGRCVQVQTLGAIGAGGGRGTGLA